MKNEPFVIERVYNAPTEKVWKAITDREQMQQWYFNLAEFRPEVGFEFEFNGGKDGRSYLHKCKVTEVVTGQKISYSWQYAGYTGYSLVTMELFAEGDKTRLRLTHGGLDTFPADNPDFGKQNFAFGWNALVGERLKQFVEETAEEKTGRSPGQ